MNDSWFINADLGKVCTLLRHVVAFDVSLQHIQRRRSTTGDASTPLFSSGRAPSILCRDAEPCSADLHVAHLSADSHRHKHITVCLNSSLNFRSCGFRPMS